MSSGLPSSKRLDAPVYYPTLADVAGSFESYIERLEQDPRFSEAGICKIVAPKGWTPCASGYAKCEMELHKPIKQHAIGSKGLYRTVLVEQKTLSLQKGFAPLALSKEWQPSAAALADSEEMERQFWRNLTRISPPLYGADNAGSLFDADKKGWNLRKLDTLLSRTLDAQQAAIPGVTTPYLYFGMWRSFFAWHTEDLDLYSVNYLHYGARKSWYCVPPRYRQRFETCIHGMLPDARASCREFLRHKELLVSPQLLQQYSIPLVRLTQGPGEFVINYPGAYHSGFNQGYNCAESTNFGTRRWIPIGTVAGHCDCVRDTVRIDMSMFERAARSLHGAGGAAAGSSRPTSRKRARPAESEEEDEDEDEDDGGTPTPVPSSSKRRPRVADSSSDEEEEPPRPPSSSRRKQASKDGAKAAASAAKVAAARRKAKAASAGKQDGKGSAGKAGRPKGATTSPKSSAAKKSPLLVGGRSMGRSMVVRPVGRPAGRPAAPASAPVPAPARRKPTAGRGGRGARSPAAAAAAASAAAGGTRRTGRERLVSAKVAEAIQGGGLKDSAGASWLSWIIGSSTK